jgi:hypothetical protein
MVIKTAVGQIWVLGARLPTNGGSMRAGAVRR